MFIFQLDLKQKMIPIGDTDLIHSTDSYGPIFGGSKGGDICLANKCNDIESDTGAMFPKAYDYEDPILRGKTI